MTEGPQQVGGLARIPLAFVEHVKQVAELAENAQFVDTGCSRVPDSDITHQRRVMHDLEDGIGVVIQHMVQKPRVGRLVEIPACMLSNSSTGTSREMAKPT